MMKLCINSEITIAPDLRLNRTFHPVGQGAFYSELFDSYEKCKFAAVYDCGTETGAEAFVNMKGKLLKDQITEFATSLKSAGKHNLDLLFVSHLHKDHVSGIKDLIMNLPPNRIVLPMLPLDVITLSRVSNLVKYGSDATEVDDLIQELYFGNREDVIGVKPAIDYDEQVPMYPIVADRINSGTFIPLGEEPFWRYRPFNSITGDDMRVKRMMAELKKIPDVFEGGYFNSKKALEHLDELKKAYGTAMGNANDNLYTLVIESEPIVGEVEKTDDMSRCVYFGDFEPHKEVWKLFLSVIDDYAQVGTIQVPHHGSKLNWRDDMLTGNSRLCVVSAGSTNKYHLPSYWIIERISMAGIDVHVVSERPSSIVQHQICVR